MKTEVCLDCGVDFAPATEEAEVIQNVRTILKTCVGTVPLARDFGVTWEHLDKPLPVAQSLMRTAIVDAVTDFEPRARVQRVSFTGDGIEGLLKPKVVISIGDEEDE